MEDIDTAVTRLHSLFHCPLHLQACDVSQEGWQDVKHSALCVPCSLYVLHFLRLVVQIINCKLIALLFLLAVLEGVDASGVQQCFLSALHGAAGVRLPGNHLQPSTCTGVRPDRAHLRLHVLLAVHAMQHLFTGMRSLCMAAK
jgi:hypothetical protein